MSNEEKKARKKAKKVNKKVKKKAKKAKKKEKKKKGDKPGHKDINVICKTQDAGLVMPSKHKSAEFDEGSQNGR